MILYFSATGNSAHVARELARLTGDTVCDLFGRIRSGDRTAMASDRPWVIVAPTYAWRLPHIVEKLIDETPLSGSKQLYFVLTAGSGCGGAAHYARKLCARKDMEFMGCACIVMPENYIAMFRAPGYDRAVRIVKKAQPAIEAAAMAIAAGKALHTRDGGAAGRLLSAAVNRVFFGHIVGDRRFRTTDGCTGCGKCAALCPLSNITIENGRPAWHGDCTHCMACICNCPAEAIEYARASVGQVRYKCPEIK